MTDPRVDEATSPATADDLIVVAKLIFDTGEVIDDVWYPDLARRLLALAAIRDSERATREAEPLYSIAEIVAEVKRRNTTRMAAASLTEPDLRSLVTTVSNLSSYRRLPTSPEPEETTGD